jgi:chromatin structure-remodeling complex subunit SFH1
MSQYGYPQAQLGALTAQFAGQPVASTSSANSQTTRSGRASKQTKPFVPLAGPTRAPRLPSSLNPNNLPAVLPPPPQQHPLSTSSNVVLPLTRITSTGNESKQASFTTYPTRLRLGTSSLMQPNAFTSQTQAATPAAGTGANTPTAGVKRQRTTVNYAELEQFPDVLDEMASDEEGGPPRKRGPSGTPGLQPKKHLVVPGVATPPKPEVWGDGKSYLGALPPGNLVQVQPKTQTRHHPTYVIIPPSASSKLSDLSFFIERRKSSKNTPKLPALSSPSKSTSMSIRSRSEIPSSGTYMVRSTPLFSFRRTSTYPSSLAEKLVTPDAFARIFCTDLDIPESYVDQVAMQIVQQVADQTGIADLALRSEAEEKEDVEKDLRVIVNVRLLPPYPFTNIADSLPAARRPNRHRPSHRPPRMGSLLVSHS